MTLREATNIAWHVRTNGSDGVSQGKITEAFAVLEQAAEILIEKDVRYADCGLRELKGRGPK